MPLANGAFFGALTDNADNPLPDRLFLSLGFYNQTRSYSDAQFRIQTDINTFDWTNFDALTTFCQTYQLKRNWYGGYIYLDSEQWLTNFPSWSASDIVQATTNFLVAAAQRNPNFNHINICNEGILHSSASPERFRIAFGGAGATGYDWLINLSKLFRTHFPNAKLGCNDYEWESAGDDLCYGSTPPNFASPTLLPQLLSALNILLANGAQIDWMGGEGYCTQFAPSANIISAINQVAALGLPVIFTEFTPNNTPVTPLDQANQLANWQRVLPIFASSPHILGVTGPLDYRKSGSVSDSVGGYILDDTVSPPALTSTASWLQTYLNPPPPPSPPQNLAGDPWYNPCQSPTFPVPNVYLPPPSPAARYIVTVADLNQPF